MSRYFDILSHKSWFEKCFLHVLRSDLTIGIFTKLMTFSVSENISSFSWCTLTLKLNVTKDCGAVVLVLVV